MLRIRTRLFALAAFAAAGYAISVAVRPVVERPAPKAAAAAVVRVERPRSVPARVPPWAWQLQEWLSHGGTRPAAAPAHVPEWFWAWRRWRLAVGS